jgi:DNA-binding MarR family transcriptional regulator
MDNLTHRDSGVNPGPDRGAQTRSRSIDREPLRGIARRAFERQLLRRPGLKGSRRFLLQVLLNEFAWGKADCYPGNETLAAATGLSTSTIKRALHDLERMDLIRLVEDVRLGSRRRIVLLDHPHAQQVLDELARCVRAAPPRSRGRGARRPGQVAQIDLVEGFKLIPESVESLSHEVETSPKPQGGTGKISLSGLNGRTDSLPVDDERATPELHATSGGSDSPVEAPAELPPPRPPGSSSSPHRPGLLDWSSVPTDDPIIASELARRTEARQAAELAPTAAEILDAVLSPPEPSPKAIAVAVEVPADASVEPIPGGVAGTSQGAVDEAEVISVLSRLGPGATPAEIQIATLRLTRLFQDSKSMRYYAGVVREVSRGELPARIPMAALDFACRPGIKRPGAAFTSHVERCRAVRGARSKRPDG